MKWVVNEQANLKLDLEIEIPYPALKEKLPLKKRKSAMRELLV